MILIIKRTEFKQSYPLAHTAMFINYYHKTPCPTYEPCQIHVPHEAWQINNRYSPIHNINMISNHTCDFVVRPKSMNKHGIPVIRG